MTEPNADAQRFASLAWQTYSALLEAGFTAEQALELLKLTLRSGQ